MLKRLVVRCQDVHRQLCVWRKRKMQRKVRKFENKVCTKVLNKFVK